MEPANLHCRRTSIVAEAPGVAGEFTSEITKLTFTPYEGGDVLLEIRRLEGLTDDEKPIFAEPERMILTMDSLQYAAAWCKAKMELPV